MPPEMIPVDGEGQRKRVVCPSMFGCSSLMRSHGTTSVLLLRLGRQWLPLWARASVSALLDVVLYFLTLEL